MCSETQCENAAPAQKLKVELHTINLSEDSQKLVMDTLRHIYGDDFSLSDANDYIDRGSNLFNRLLIIKNI